MNKDNKQIIVSADRSCSIKTRLDALRRSAFVFITALFSLGTMYADSSQTVIPISTDANYALYEASTGVFLRLDTRDGTIIALVPDKPVKNRQLNSLPLADCDKPGRFQLYPTSSTWNWLLFDTTTGDSWLLKWSDKKDTLTKLPLLPEQ